MACDTEAQLIVNGLAEIEAEHRVGLLPGELAVRDEPAEIEERRVESGVFPVNDPKTLPVIDKVARKHVVMPEYDLDRAGDGFEPLRAREKLGQDRKMAALAFAQGVPIVADDMEHPEHRGGPAQVFWNVVVTSPGRVHQPLEIGGVPDVLGGQGASRR